MFTRRVFLASAPALAGAAPAKLALDGGSPVREKPLRPRHFGPLYYDESEWSQLVEVFKAKAPFRWYGMDSANPPRKVITFEKEFAARMQTRYAVAVTSGTTALQAALAALAVGPGDEVIVPAWTWHSCFNAVVLAGALPVCAEIDTSFNLDPADVERHITPATKVLMIVHLQGNPAHIQPLMEIARKHKLKVLEDCSQSVGADYRGKPIGSYGDISIASLQVNKTISAGEGGAVYTNSPELFERAARFHDMGMLREPHQTWAGGAHVEPFLGTNFRMTEFTGGVLLAQIRKLDQVVADVRKVAKRVYDGIRDLPKLELRGLPDPAGELGSAIFIGLPDKAKCDRFLKAMAAENVPASRPGGSVVLPLVPQIQKKATASPNWPSFSSERGRAMRYDASTCPKTIRILERFAGVSVDPKYTEKDTADIVAAIRKVYSAILGS